MRHFLMTAAVLGLALGTAAAEDCIPSTSTPIAEAAGVYLAGNLGSLVCNPTCLLDVWVYHESNGIEGLQRGDEIVDDTCGGEIASDQIVL